MKIKNYWNGIDKRRKRYTKKSHNIKYLGTSLTPGLRLCCAIVVIKLPKHISVHNDDDIIFLMYKSNILLRLYSALKKAFVEPFHLL